MKPTPTNNSPPEPPHGKLSPARQPAAVESHGLEHWVHWTLLSGLIVSGVLLIAGLALTLVHHERAAEGPPAKMRELLRDAMSGSGSAILFLGIIALICTPVLRVAVLAVGWFAWGDRRFALTASIVLALLALGMTLGLG